MRFSLPGIRSSTGWPHCVQRWLFECWAVFRGLRQAGASIRRFFLLSRSCLRFGFDLSCGALSSPEVVYCITYAWQTIGRIIATLDDPLQDLMNGQGFLGASKSGTLKTGLKERVLFFKTPALVKRLAKSLRRISDERVKRAVDEYLGPNVGGPWRMECLFDVKNALKGFMCSLNKQPPRESQWFSSAATSPKQCRPAIWA